MTPATPLPTDLLGMLYHLERHGWEYRLSSRVIPDGTRRFTAVAWKSDALGGGSKCRHETPAGALTAALLSARKQRQRRHHRQAKRTQPVVSEVIA